ncbi:MAG: 3-oxoacyl-[acyl-carrier-protein] reductase [Deltaproteobacteria bacterium]|nr:3-oxoacyl-[acyl-carrier-protein] reductase [Deltaproteobacteria bacterium]
MDEFKEKVILVSGGSRGIGKAIVISFLQAGGTVCVINRSKQSADDLTQEVKQYGDQFFSFLGDISKNEDCQKFAELVYGKYGKIDILINNAGVTSDGLFLSMKPEAWEQVVSTNLNGTFYLCKTVIRAMVKARFGRIINISSVVGYTGNPGQVNYSASKSALIGFTKSLAKEVASRNVTCNLVAPGFIETDMTGSLNEVQVKATLESVPMKKMGAPQDIADGVLFLASSKASYITGTTLHINGGMY